MYLLIKTTLVSKQELIVVIHNLQEIRKSQCTRLRKRLQEHKQR